MKMAGRRGEGGGFGSRWGANLTSKVPAIVYKVFNLRCSLKAGATIESGVAIVAVARGMENNVTAKSSVMTGIIKLRLTGALTQLSSKKAREIMKN